MLQSMKLRTDQLSDANSNNNNSTTSNSNNAAAIMVDNGLGTTTATLNSTLYTTTSNSNAGTLSAPVARVVAAPAALATAHANGLGVVVYTNNSNTTGSNNNNGNIIGNGDSNVVAGNIGINNNNKHMMMVNNNHLNNMQQHSLQLQHQQLQQYQNKYLESAIAAETAAAASAATINSAKVTTSSKTFHPYSRPPPPTVSHTSASSPALCLSSFGYSTQINSNIGNLKTNAATAVVSNNISNNNGTTDTSTASSGLLTFPATTSSSSTTTTTTDLSSQLPTTQTSSVTLLAKSSSSNSMELQSSETNPITTNLSTGSTIGGGSSNDDVHTNTENIDSKSESTTNDSLALVPFTPMECSEMPSATTTDEFSKDQPDPDTIKMFVGQVPKAWDETKLRALFEQYGRVHTLNVLRDKVTMMSRGCCFVTYYTRKAALKAQDALHNIKTLDGMHHPIQMKPADSENRNERKLFVGMLNKKYNEADVRQLFAGHGTIEECTVLRDQNGQSKGCAFVTFDTKQHAIGAIKALHHSQTMEGCSAPLVVKFADTQKEKDQKKLQQLSVGLCGITALTTPTAAAPRTVLGALTAAAPATPALSSATQLVSATPVAAAVSVATAPRPIASLATISAAPASLPVSAAGGASAAALIPTSTASMFVTHTPTSATQPVSPYLTAADGMLPNSAAAAQMQIFQQLQAYGLQPAHYLQGLNFPPDHSTTAAAAATISANNAAAAAAAAAAATGSATANAANNTGSSNGLLASSLSMQNLVALASMNHGSMGQHNAAAYATSQQGGHYVSVPTSKALTASVTHPHSGGAAGIHMASSYANTGQHHLAHQTTTQQQQQQQQQQLQQQHHFASLHAAAAHHHPHATMAAMATGATPAAAYAAHFAGNTAGTALYALTSQYAPALNPLTNGAYAAATAPLAATALQAAAAGVAGKQIEGPDGSNLFIYHLPQEFNDTDLASTFLPFGNVLSAKVFIDKQTNLSKCFGFVSYDNPHSAGAAIQAMHGFQIGTKRLKVQLKRSKDAAKPY
ncbi:uncharacterized protein isoform X2 [Musca autumnalis]|uniref:uncharacterized protein isoform X2 n=1 Tax=Musca autumnalis TaxID=221902 RepID=UPI003CE733B9